MTDEELIARLRKAREKRDEFEAVMLSDTSADRIEALLREKAAAYAQGYGDCEAEISLTEIGRTNEFLHGQIAKWKARAERLEVALREVAADASVTVHTWKNGINFKKMYEGWRKIATDRIDIARAALKGDDHE